jgi:hypothetical protein
VRLNPDASSCTQVKVLSGKHKTLFGMLLSVFEGKLTLAVRYPELPWYSTGYLMRGAYVVLEPAFLAFIAEGSL